MPSCPFCKSETPPTKQKKISTAGWILFVVLILLCIPLCWLPFVLDAFKENVSSCPDCGKTWT